MRGNRKCLAGLFGCLVLLSGCADKNQPSVPVEEPDWRVEAVDWQIVSVDPEDFGITYGDLENLEEYPLDKLTAYCIRSDGIYAEDGVDELYRRFLEAPHTCITYFALIQDEQALSGLYGLLTLEDVCGHGGTQEFQMILKQLAEAYPAGPEAKAAADLQAAYDEALAFAEEIGFLSGKS